MVEQSARTWNGLFMNFNGTAGLWRRTSCAVFLAPSIRQLCIDVTIDDLGFYAEVAGVLAAFRAFLRAAAN
jgi:hypothetical protein